MAVIPYKPPTDPAAAAQPGQQSTPSGRKPEVIHRDKWAKEKALEAKAAGEFMKQEHDDIRKQLDVLRRTRKDRGGVGEPLKVPGHLSGGPVVVTDEDLNANFGSTLRGRNR